VTVSDISAWVALAAAVLSIVVEIWRARAPRRPAGFGADAPRSVGQSRVPPFFRGAGLWSFLPIVALILAAHALGLYSDELYHRSRLLREGPGGAEDLEALQLSSQCTFARTVVTLLGIIIAILLIRAIGNGVIRWYYYYVPAAK
jgi:hypothetical protein